MITIAIDGYSSTGKSTMARWLAAEIGYRYIDSGAMYRAVTFYALQHDLISSAGDIDEAAVIAALPKIKVDFVALAGNRQATLLNGSNVEKDIREMNVSRFVSQIAAIPEVRYAMAAQQKAMGTSGGVVMDGRDIGTTVFPDAELKLFVTASAEVRAQRRFKELMAKGEKVTLEDVLENVKQRDWLDEHREVSPLRRASDAVLIDNTAMTIDDQNALVLSLARQAITQEK